MAVTNFPLISQVGGFKKKTKFIIMGVFKCCTTKNFKTSSRWNDLKRAKVHDHRYSNVTLSCCGSKISKHLLGGKLTGHSALCLGCSSYSKVAHRYAICYVDDSVVGQLNNSKVKYFLESTRLLLFTG